MQDALGNWSYLLGLLYDFVTYFYAVDFEGAYYFHCYAFALFLISALGLPRYFTNCDIKDNLYFEVYDNVYYNIFIDMCIFVAL